MRRQVLRGLAHLQSGQTSHHAQEATSLATTSARWLASDAMRGTTVLCVRKDQQVQDRDQAAFLPSLPERLRPYLHCALPRWW